MSDENETFIKTNNKDKLKINHLKIEQFHYNSILGRDSIKSFIKLGKRLNCDYITHTFGNADVNFNCSTRERLTKYLL